MSVFAIGDLRVPPGEVGLGKVLCGYLPDSSPVHMPLIVLNGANSGPTLWLGAAMHGIEIGGIEVIRRVVREILDPRQVSGTVIGAPIVNPFAYRAATVRTPQDGQNLNRTFPGSPTQLLSGRLAHLLTTELLPKSDFIVDLHSNMRPSILHAIVSVVGSPEMVRKCAEMADAFGVTTIWAEANIEDQTGGKTVRTSGANLTEWAHANGKPALAIELVDSRRIDRYSVGACVTGVINVMKYLGMVPGDRVVPEYRPNIEGKLARTTLTANKGGVIEIVVDAGEPVAAGGLIANIRDPWGDVVEQVVSPVDGYPIAFPLHDNQTVGTGEYVVFVAYRKS